MSWRAGFSLCALAVAACTTPSPRTAPGPSHAQPRSPADLVAAIKTDADRSEHESDAKAREELAAQARRDAQSCLALDPEGAPCLYGEALSIGLEARAHPAHASDLLASMLQSLAKADAADPTYDEAGPARVRALVLIRAPGWPFGPGDTFTGLLSARRAVALRPQFPPNLLALAESLAKNGDTDGSREMYARAREAALALPPAVERDSWLHEANQALQRR